MKKTIDFYDFRDAFERFDRIDAFSPNGLGILFECLTELEDETGKEMELDVIGICCEFAEMTMNEIIDAYSSQLDEDKLFKDGDYQYVMDWLNNQTWVLGDTETGTIIFQQF